MIQMRNIIAWGLALFLTACSESFPGLYAPDTDDSFNSGEVTTDWNHVPILPSLTDPDYDILVPTRGSGVFDSWEEDRERWMAADFHTFAFLTRNTFGGEANYALKDNAEYCLLNDQLMNIQNSSFDLKFKDKKNRYYSQTRQNYRYKFYMYYADDADAGTSLNYETKRVTRNVTIDGTQDVMHGFAYHTTEELNKALDKLPQGNDESKVMSQYGSELLYSTISGHRGINPIFHMKHLLTRLDVMIKGEQGSDGSDSYRKIIVKNIKIVSPAQGTLVIANDDWTEASYLQAWKKGEILQFSSDSKKELYCQILDKPHDYPNVPQYGGFHVSTTSPETVSKPLLVAPMEALSLVIEYLYLDVNTMTGELEREPELCTVPYPNIRLVGQEGVQGFEPGKSYTIRIYVYGMQDIQIQVVELPTWEDGGSIDVGKDEDNNEN